MHLYKIKKKNYDKLLLQNGFLGFKNAFLNFQNA